MKNNFFFLFILGFIIPSFSIAQSSEIMDFEGTAKGESAWFTGDPTFYSTSIVDTESQQGKHAMQLASNTSSSTDAFGVCSIKVPVSVMGKKIKLVGYAKSQEIKNGYGGFWLRLDSESQMIALDNMNDRGITGTTPWTKYEIELDLHEETSILVFGGILTGKGKLWIDNLSLWVDGKPLKEAKSKPIISYPADEVDAINLSKKTIINNLSTNQNRNLFIFAKIWGFLKYYHPEVGKGNINLDAEFFKIMPSMLSAKKEEEALKIISTWIKKMGEVMPCRSCKSLPETDYKLLPSLDWINEKFLGKSLFEQLNHIKINRHQGSNYYVKPGRTNTPNFIEKSYPKMDFKDDGFRLLAVFRYWNIIEYFFPYKHLIGEDWDLILAEYILKIIVGDDELSYKKTLLNLITEINDSHALGYDQTSTIKQIIGERQTVYKIEFIEGQAVVTDIIDQSKVQKEELQIGDLILRVNGKSTSDIFEERRSFYPASNQVMKYSKIYYELLNTEKESVQVEIQRANKIHTFDLPTFLRNEFDAKAYYAKNHPEEWYKLITPEIGYISLHNVKSKEFNTIFDQYKNTKGLIIDIRNYPSEFVVYSLGKFLMPAPIQFSKITSVDYNYPGLFQMHDSLYVGENNPNFYKGKVIILVNEKSMSQSEFTAMAFRQAPQSKVVGSMTAGADGNVVPIILPGNIRTSISSLGIYNPDETETQRVGIVPDVLIQPTIKGIMEGKDEVLEKAIQLIER